MIYYDLREESVRHGISNAVAREKEMLRMARTAKRHYNNNVLVRGANGVGKTALLEGFAYRIATDQISGMEQCQILKLESADIKKYCGPGNNSANNEGATYLLNAFHSLPENCIVVIDDMQNILSEQNIGEMQRIFEPFFERNDIRLVAAISDLAFQKLAASGHKFFQYFELLHLQETDRAETAAILTAIQTPFEQEYGVSIPEQAIAAITDAALKFNGEIKMPLRAIHLLDECLAYAKIAKKQSISETEIREIIAEKTGAPSLILDASQTELLKNLEQHLSQSVVGQEQAVKIISSTVRRSRLGLRNSSKPYGSFLLLGPSGTGKTELSRTLAATVYNSQKSFTRIDMSEFSEAHTVQRLIGAPPGYVGFDAGGQLTNAIKEKPYSLVLLDEIEKAHPKIFDIFLQVLEDGRLSDGQGQMVNFTDTTVIATSNLGVNQIISAYSAGQDIHHPQFMEQTVMPLLLRHFRAEFVNRFDAIIIFNPLSNADLLQIAKLEISKVEKRMAQHGIKFRIDEQTLNKKVLELADWRFGARPIKRFVEQTCENLIALKLIG